MYAVFNGEQHIMGSNLAKLEANGQAKHISVYVTGDNLTNRFWGY